MKNRGKAWTFAAVACLAIWCLGGWLVYSFSAEPAEPAKPAIKGWIHVFGCPRASQEDDTNNDIILMFSDGTIAHLKQHKLTDDQKTALSLMLTMNGLNLIYNCGTQS